MCGTTGRRFISWSVKPIDRITSIWPHEPCRAGGHLILATFAAPDGPSQCSGLEVRRYDAELARIELGDAFTLVRKLDEVHTTPQGNAQRFFWGVFRRQP